MDRGEDLGQEPEQEEEEEGLGVPFLSDVAMELTVQSDEWCRVFLKNLAKMVNRYAVFLYAEQPGVYSPSEMLAMYSSTGIVMNLPFKMEKLPGRRPSCHFCGDVFVEENRIYTMQSCLGKHRLHLACGVFVQSLKKNPLVTCVGPVLCKHKSCMCNH